MVSTSGPVPRLRGVVYLTLFGLISGGVGAPTLFVGLAQLYMLQCSEAAGASGQIYEYSCDLVWGGTGPAYWVIAGVVLLSMGVGGLSLALLRFHSRWITLHPPRSP